MICPVCHLNMPDEIAKFQPCEKCGCMDFLSKEVKKQVIKKKDTEAAIMTYSVTLENQKKRVKK